MSTGNTPAGSSVVASPAAPAKSPAAPPSWPWRRAALLLAGAAQLITVSDLVSAAPLAATWSSLLLAIAPAPVNLLAAVAGVVVLVVGVVAQITHIGVLFVPALVALAVGAVKLWREQSKSRGHGGVR